MPKISMIKARFLGKNSLGYRHFHIYELFTWIENGYIVIERFNEGDRGRCPYESVAAFIENWQIIYGSDENETIKQEAQTSNNLPRPQKSRGI